MEGLWGPPHRGGCSLAQVQPPGSTSSILRGRWLLCSRGLCQHWPQDGLVDRGKVAGSFTPSGPETMTMTIIGNTPEVTLGCCTHNQGTLTKSLLKGLDQAVSSSERLTQQTSTAHLPCTRVCLHPLSRGDQIGWNDINVGA